MRTSASAALLALSLASTFAHALPKAGEAAPDGKLEDADGRVLETRTLKGKPTLIVYEDKGSSAQNKELKEELAKLAKGDKYKAAVALAAVADLTSYDFWPVKGFVKDAIRDESKKQGTTIYCDWNGKFRKAFGMKQHDSNVVLVGKDGRVLFAGHGALSADERALLIKLLRAEVEPPV